MDKLEAFLDDGLTAVPPARLGLLASDVRDRCYLTGDVRYCIAAECIEIIASCWGDDGAVRKSIADELDAFAVTDLAGAIREIDPEASRSLALGARSSLLAISASAGDLIYE